MEWNGIGCHIDSRTWQWPQQDFGFWIEGGRMQRFVGSCFDLHLRPVMFHLSHRLHLLLFCPSKEVISHRLAESNSIRQQDFKGCEHLHQRMQDQEDYKRRRWTWDGPFYNSQRCCQFGYIAVSLLTMLQRAFPKSFLFHCFLVVFFFSHPTQFAGAVPLSTFNLYLATGSQPTIRERHHKMPSRDVIIIAQMSAICLRW